MFWMRRRATADERQRELLAQYESWQEQADRACATGSAECATDFASLDGERRRVSEERPEMTLRAFE